ncbi:MAG: Asp23/Gls24 family envelope stress response protein [Streptococcaceae bacterium]|jgi:uncharacterized alkaline shock family protein YloU|nr:Asp23/Gls24 family envelope stress response protein [Streptococcaceae bacterium]
MNKEEKVTLDSAELGNVVVAPEVIEVIIGIAASKVDGVYGMRGTFANNVAKRLGRRDYDKGIYLSSDEDESLIADIYTYLKYGVSVPKVAIDMQKKVKQQVFFMSGLNLKEINIHVVGVVLEKSSKVDTSDLFDDGDEN